MIVGFCYIMINFVISIKIGHKIMDYVQDLFMRRIIQVIDLNPSALKAWYRRGDSYLHLSNWKNALADFKQAELLDPTCESIKDKVRLGA